jgi:predicted RNase H-like nuclease (RuvC/YqgF family)
MNVTPTNGGGSSKANQQQQAKLIQRLEEQVRILNTYIKELARENETLQDKNNDMRTTLIQNK